MLDFLELEETVGRAWHRLVGATASYPLHSGEAATLADVQGQIAVMFRALDGRAARTSSGEIPIESSPPPGRPAWLVSTIS